MAKRPEPVTAAEPANPPFLPVGPHECEDDDVRLFLTLAGWNVESDDSRSRHAATWRFLNSLAERAEKRRGYRATIIIGIFSAIFSGFLGIALPKLWTLSSGLFGH